MPIADWIWRNSKVGIDSNCDEAGKNDPEHRAVGRFENPGVRGAGAQCDKH